MNIDIVDDKIGSLDFILQYPKKYIKFPINVIHILVINDLRKSEFSIQSCVGCYVHCTRALMYVCVNDYLSHRVEILVIEKIVTFDGWNDMDIAGVLSLFFHLQNPQTRPYVLFAAFAIYLDCLFRFLNKHYPDVHHPPVSIYAIIGMMHACLLGCMHACFPSMHALLILFFVL